MSDKSDNKAVELAQAYYAARERAKQMPCAMFDQDLDEAHRAEVEHHRRRLNELEQLLVEAANYVRDAGSDEDPETQRLSRDLWRRIRKAVPGLPK